jgi:hypothetical protein
LVTTSPPFTEQSERVSSGRPQERAIRSCSKNAESLSPLVTTATCGSSTPLGLLRKDGE